MNKNYYQKNDEGIAEKEDWARGRSWFQAGLFGFKIGISGLWI